MDTIFNPQMLTSFFGILAAILVLGILVAVHELGHLLLAKAGGIRVDVFSVGMGKAVWSVKRGETLYQIGSLPFGGFCSFGEDNEESKKDPRSILNAPLWAKALAIIGGSLFNIIFAYLALTIIFGLGYKERRFTNTVQVPVSIEFTGQEQTSPAYAAGLRSGDTIIAIAGYPIASFTDIPSALAYSTQPKPLITYISKNKTNNVAVKPIKNRDTGIDLLGVRPVSLPVIQELSPSSPAQSAGLRPEDKIISIDGVSVTYAHEVEEILTKASKIQKLVIERGEERLNFDLIPETAGIGMDEGITFTPPIETFVLIKANNIGQAINMAGIELLKQVDNIFVSLQKLFTGKVNVQKNLSGPVRIVAITSQIAGTLDILLLARFMVMLSVALAIFNMLPIPGLDGGVLLLNITRSAFKRTPVAAPVEKIVNTIEHLGLILLLSLAVFVFINDIRNIAGERKAAAQVQKK